MKTRMILIIDQYKHLDEKYLLHDDYWLLNTCITMNIIF